MRCLSILITLSILAGLLAASNEELQSATASPEASQLPKPNAEAEQLTLEATGALTAPQDIYERVVSELAAIRAAHPAVAKVLARRSWAPGNVLIGFDAAGAMAVEEGRYTAWDALNARYGVTQIDMGALKSWGGVRLEFAGRFNARLVAKEYAKLPNVQYAQVSRTIYPTDGDDVCLFIDGETPLLSQR